MYNCEHKLFQNFFYLKVYVVSSFLVIWFFESNAYRNIIKCVETAVIDNFSFWYVRGQGVPQK